MTPSKNFLLFLNPLGKSNIIHSNCGVFFKECIYLFIFRDRGREGEREGEKHQYVVASHVPPTGDLAHNPGMCPNWESNRQLPSSQASTPSTEPYQPGLKIYFLIGKCIPFTSSIDYWCNSSSSFYSCHLQYLLFDPSLPLPTGFLLRMFSLFPF